MLACVAAPGGAGAAVTGAGGGGLVRAAEERVALWGSLGEGEVDMGRRWRACRRPGEQERRWRGLGVEDGSGQRGEREALWGLWGEGEVDMGRRWRVWAPGLARAAGAGPWGVLVAPWGAGAARVSG